MKIVCTDNVLFAKDAFKTIGDVELVSDKKISRLNLANAEMFFSRSTVKIDENLIGNTPVRFIGTATIGTDHIDMDYLNSAGIKWCAAPGCNANSVAEYLVSALLCLATRHNFSIREKTIGVIGVGNVGKQVVKKAGALGMKILQNDPPLADTTGDPAFVPLDKLLAESDIITLHVPLTAAGPYPTRRMAAKSFFDKLKTGSIFINAARGGVVETDALIDAIQTGTVAHTIIDTWGNEPSVRTDILDLADIATPHIAGHSFEGKAMGTEIIYREACRFIKTAPSWSCKQHLSPGTTPPLRVNGAEKTGEQILRDAVNKVYNVETDDTAFRSAPDRTEAGISNHFRKLRQEYPVRREFRFSKIRASNCNPDTLKTLSDLGFEVLK